MERDFDYTVLADGVCVHFDTRNDYLRRISSGQWIEPAVKVAKA
jgi:hypothetical protein